jgi:hypothetical protein
MSTASAIPVRLKVGEVVQLLLGPGEEVVAVGSTPHGRPVLLSPRDWDIIKRWGYVRLSARSGHVRACGGGVHCLAARLLTGTDNDATKVIRYWNGNALDLRRSNIVVVPWGLLRCAQRSSSREPSAPRPMVAQIDGTLRPSRKPWPPAPERLRQLLSG